MSDNFAPESVSFACSLKEKAQMIKELEEQLVLYRQQSETMKRQYIDSIELSIHRAIATATDCFDWPGGHTNQVHKNVISPNVESLDLENQDSSLACNRWLAHVRLGETGEHIGKKNPQVYIRFDIYAVNEKEYLVEFAGCLEGFCGSDELLYNESHQSRLPLQIFEQRVLTKKERAVSLTRLDGEVFEDELSKIMILAIEDCLRKLKEIERTMREAMSKFDIINDSLRRVKSIKKLTQG